MLLVLAAELAGTTDLPPAGVHKHTRFVSVWYLSQPKHIVMQINQLAQLAVQFDTDGNKVLFYSNVRSEIHSKSHN
jgi:hypothetical protein